VCHALEGDAVAGEAEVRQRGKLREGGRELRGRIARDMSVTGGYQPCLAATRGRQPALGEGGRELRRRIVPVVSVTSGYQLSLAGPGRRWAPVGACLRRLGCCC